MICNICKAIDFLPLDEHRDKAEIIRNRKNEAFLFTPPDFYNDPEIREWRNGNGTIHGYYFHYDTGNALLESARIGCYLCAVMSFALFEDSKTDSELDLDLQNMPKSQYPVVLATVLYPDRHHWRTDIRHEYLNIAWHLVDIFQGNPLDQAYRKLGQTLELAWEHKEIPPHLSTWSQLNIELATKWYQNCLSTHPTCRVGKPLLPKRVIDVGNATGSDEPVLIEPAVPTYSEYVTLSHCWGDGTPLVPIEIDGVKGKWSLPLLSTWEKTFQDTVTVVKSLNIRYLWIDAPCILQGPANRLDWEIESVKMAHYYQNATLCVCATKGRSSADGLFSVRSPLLTYPFQVHLPAQDGMAEFERFLCAGTDELLFYRETTSTTRSPLSTRAWCLQEEILSPRMLQFSHKQILWQCLSTTHSESSIGKSESTSASSDPTLQDTGLVKMHVDTPLYTAEWGGSRNPYYDAWYQALHRFNLRNISYQNDILPAISGIAESFYPHLVHDEYLAGLWRGDLAIGLLWSTADFDPMRPSVGLSQKNFDQSSLYAPSWSWIAMARKPLLLGSYKRLETTATTTTLACLQSAEIDLKNKKAPFGLIEFGMLVFLTQLPRITITPDVKQKPIFHEEFYFAETSVRRNIQPRPDRRMEMLATEWELQSKSYPRSPVSAYQLVGQCDLDDYSPTSNLGVATIATSAGTQGSSHTTIDAFFLPLKTDRAEFGRIRSVGLLLVKASVPHGHPDGDYFQRIGCGKFDMGPAAWKACKLPQTEVRLI